ncbi:MAG: lysophospholipid acyltransferase family protein [Flavobacterium sp.]
MKIFKIIFWILWRVWFYILIGVLILLLFPFLFISILKESWYPFFFKLARIWARSILFGMGFRVKFTAEASLQSKGSYMFVANHTSMMDIMLMLSVVKNPFVFVGKKELAKIPLFGFFYKRTCILVDRNNSKSRHLVYASAQKRLQQGLSICIFPEGQVPEEESILLAGFKDGAFRLAIEHQILIVPLTFADNKKRFSYTFFSGSPGIMRAKLHSPISTRDLTLQDKKDIKDKVWHLIHHQLLEYQK